MRQTVKLFLILVLLTVQVVRGQDAIPWVPMQQVIDSSGDPLASGKVYTYIAGTTTNQATYTDSTAGTANANPVILDSAGRANIWLDETLSYRIDVYTSADVLVYSIDNIVSNSLFSTVLTIGTGAASDIKILYDGNALDFHWGLDDSSDTLVLGRGSVLGTTATLSLDANGEIWVASGEKLTFSGSGAASSKIGEIYNNSGDFTLNYSAGSAGDDFILQSAGVPVITFSEDVGMILNNVDQGNNAAGQNLTIGQNSNTGAEGTAAGTLNLEEADGTASYLWTDATGKLRIHTAPPSGSSGSPTTSDTAGSVVGDQTSWYGAKRRIRPYRDSRRALEAVGAVDLYEWEYRESSYRNPDGTSKRFIGPVIYPKDKHGKGPWYAKNMGRQQQPAFDPVTSISMSFLAIRELERRLELQERENRRLRYRLDELETQDRK